MKSKKIQNAIGMVDSDLLERADKYTKKPKRKHIRWIAPLAAALVIVILSGVIFGGSIRELFTDSNTDPTSTERVTLAPEIEFKPVSLKPYCLSEAVYPERVINPNIDHTNLEEWHEERRTRRENFGAGDNLDEFFVKTIDEFLKDSKGENIVYSPLNVYMALAMIAETTEGDSRQQILDLIGAEDIESLRTQANAMWNANYQDDGVTTSKLASSLWLDRGLEYSEDLLNNLAEYYYASTFNGEMGSEEYNDALKTWINEQTGNLLREQIADLELSPDTIMTLATTVYFKDQWVNGFSEGNTYREVFHSADGDVNIPFMHRSDFSGAYYWGENFSATSKALEGRGNMYFIRPDDGVDVEDLLSDSETMSFIMYDEKYEYKNSKYTKVNMSIPKFDVSSSMDLKEGIENLGVIECFTSAGDFAVFYDSEYDNGVYLSEIEHSARVKIDEEGVEAAAVVCATLAGSAMPEDEVDFVLDKPFIFVITNDDELPLFVGVVNNP
ncbi:MAG: hypothetical protein IKJ83_02105 [Ruminococcus sp.]|nr:hypothetical protein [Ruminococcus sp.]